MSAANMSMTAMEARHCKSHGGMLHDAEIKDMQGGMQTSLEKCRQHRRMFERQLQAVQVSV